MRLDGRLGLEKLMDNIGSYGFAFIDVWLF